MENAMTEKDWKDVDSGSREVFKALLAKLGAADIEDSRGNCCVDVLFTLKGVRCAAELKRRSFPHDRYGDVFGEAIKLECSQRRMGRGQFRRVWIANDFADGVIAIANLDDPRARRFTKMCPATSLVKGASRQYIAKECLSLPQTVKVKYWRTADGWKFQKT